MAAGEQGSTHPLVILETWPPDERFPTQETFLISSANLDRIITLPFSTLTSPW